MTKFRLAFALAAAMGASLALSGSASSMPINNLGSDVAQTIDTAAQQVRWVCGPYGCVWRPGRAYYAPYRYYGYYGRPRYYGYYGRPWRRW